MQGASELNHRVPHAQGDPYHPGPLLHSCPCTRFAKARLDLLREPSAHLSGRGKPRRQLTSITAAAHRVVDHFFDQDSRGRALGFGIYSAIPKARDWPAGRYACPLHMIG